MNRMSRMLIFTRYGALAVLTAVATTSGCSDASGPDSSIREVGIMQLLPALATLEGAANPDSTISWDVPPGDGSITAPRTIEVADTVAVGESFSVIVYTIGVNGCWGPDGQDGTVAGRVIEITPFDIHSGADVCTQVLAFLAHERTFTVDQPGAWTIRARGRRVRGIGMEDPTPVVAERTIVARTPPSALP